MEITLLAKPEGGVIARELQLGSPEGEFYLEPTGSVAYRSPHDELDWFAAPSAQVFAQAADCWNRYSRLVVVQTDADQLATVSQLRSDLKKLGVLTGSSVWSSFVEQAEHGLL